MNEKPLVSCLCVTRRRVELLRRACGCFHRQTYSPRELVVLYEADDTETPEFLRTQDPTLVRSVEVPASPRLTLGALRNRALASGRGVYMAQWDDDDWYAPNRLEVQIGALQATGKSGCVLWQWTIFDTATQKAYLPMRTGWEGSLVAVREAVPPYAELARGEDTPAVRKMYLEGKLLLIDAPDIYVYVFHGGNTWDRAHFDAQVQAAQPFSDAATRQVRVNLGYGDP